MSRKSKRELERIIEDLQRETRPEIDVSSNVVTITEDMTDDRGRLLEDAVGSVPGTATVHETSSPAVTVWTP